MQERLIERDVPEPDIYNKDFNDVLDQYENSIDCIVTDPPYGISFTGNRWRNTEFDELRNDDTVEHMRGIGEKFAKVLKEDRHAYVFCRWDTYPTILPFFEPLELDTVIIWNKGKGGHGMGDLDDYAPQHEFILKFSHGDRAIQGKRIPNVLTVEDIRQTQEQKIHPTQKPIKLLQILIEKSTKEGETVADFFAGSFSTGKACQRTGRHFVGTEIDETFYEEGRDWLGV